MPNITRGCRIILLPELSGRRPAKAPIWPVGRVSAFAEFGCLGLTMETEMQRDAFTRMVAAIRLDSGRRGTPTAENLQLILLGSSAGASMEESSC